MSNEQKNVMLSLSKHLYRFVESIELLARSRCFDKLSMTFCFIFLYARSSRFHVPFSQLYLSVLGRACQKYLLVSTAKLGCM